MVLSDLFDVIGGGTPKTSEDTYWNGNIPWLSVKDFGGDKKYVYTTEKSITQKGLDNSSTKLLYKDDIIVSARGTVGEIAMIPFNMAFNQSCFGLRVNKDNNPHFVYYLVKYKLNELKAQSQGSVFDTIIKTTFDKIDCLDYSKETQSRIASILSSLDSKIETNNKINAKLEEMAQALFKSWFVDFEPFKDKGMVESELGMIPEGWRVGKLSEMGSVVCGKTPSKAISDYYNGDVPFVKIPDMHNKVFVSSTEDSLTEEGSNSQIKKLIPAYSLMVSCIATVGLVSINTKPSHTNQQINTIIPNNSNSLYYMFELLRTKEEYLQSLGRGGTATLNVNTKTFSNIAIIIPTEEVLDSFTNALKGVFSKIESNQQESSRLSHLCDTLLPKLMSGEIDLDSLS